jgi:chromosome segregation ATPase
MPNKSNQKKLLKRNPNQSSLNRLSERVGGLETRMGHLETRVDGLSRKVDTLQQQFRQHRKEFKAFQRGTAQEFAAVRHDMAEGFVKIETRFQFWGELMIKMGDSLSQKIEMMEEKNAEFRDQMLTLMDGVTKKYDEFRVEKTALAAGQDRLQKQIDRLNESDGQQNDALRELDVRMTRLEAA